MKKEKIWDSINPNVLVKCKKWAKKIESRVWRASLTSFHHLNKNVSFLVYLLVPWNYRQHELWIPGYNWFKRQYISKETNFQPRNLTHSSNNHRFFTPKSNQYLFLFFFFFKKRETAGKPNHWHVIKRDLERSDRFLEKVLMNKKFD